jgi:glutaminase
VTAEILTQEQTPSAASVAAVQVKSGNNFRRVSAEYTGDGKPKRLRQRVVSSGTIIGFKLHKEIIMTLSSSVRTAVILLLCLLAPVLHAGNELAKADINAALDAAYTKYKTLQEGANADYIPALAKVDSDIYGIALVTPEGEIYTTGDVKSEVSIQSISKVFTMALVMDEKGPKSISDSMGVDATGQVFNSIVAVEQYKGAEMNPLVNAGAITATSMVSGGSRAEIWNKILSYYNDFAGRELSVNQEVFDSEAATNQRNQAIAKLMYAYGHIKSNPDQATDIYTEQCSVNVNARDLAIMAATLANGGRNPITGKQVMKNENVAEVLAVMATAG